MARRSETTIMINRPPDRVFEAITDVHGLPTWNERILAVDVGPERLEAGDEWVVVMDVLGRRFRSRSKVLELDRVTRRFVHNSSPDDDNPSHTVWTWEVAPATEGAAVTLRWDLRPLTLGRRIAALIRSHMIPDEARASIRQLEDRC